GLCSSGRVRPLGPYVGMTVPTHDLSYAQAVVIVIQIGGVVPYRSAMADIVLGVGTSHTPQISVPWAEWPTLGRTQEPSPHIPSDIDAQLTPEVFQRRHSAAQAAVKQLGEILRAAELDAIVIFGDDQH